MKAAVLNKPGGPEDFKLDERPIPHADGEHVLVKVKAFGLNRSELMTRKGLSPDVKFPRVLGIECVGEVVNDASGILKSGQKVAAFMGGMGREYDGSYSEYTVIPRYLLYPFESHLSWKLLGAVPEMFQTVYGSLHLALNIKKGETLLIRGGTSSIGMLAIQLAKNYGLTVIATTRKLENKALLLDNGANYALIDDGLLAEKVKVLFPSGVEKVLELVGTATLNDSLKCASQGGIVCMTGMLSEQWSISEFAPMEIIPATVHLTIYDSGQVRLDSSVFQQFIQQVESGLVKLNISRSFTLSQISDAHQFMESNSAVGKIVVLTEPL